MFGKCIWSVVVFLSCYCVIFGNAATETTYKAAVVEYNPSGNSIGDYLETIEGIKELVDLIVFPESTLSGGFTFVPDPANETIPCNSTADFEDYLKQLSCAAANRSVYLVVNLKEQSNCTTQSQAAIGDKRPCATTGYNLYNTDVAFDRTGAVVARYRKYNLFGERSLNTTLTPDISTFTTDYNVTYGLFTCFDILFETPALALTRQNITNIIFPSMWFSELPFLTALQAQQMFAVATNVNFLSSGANSPVRGSGGTGIFQGAKGPLVYDYVEAGGTEVLIADVAKSPDLVEEGNEVVEVVGVSEEEIDARGKAMDGFTLIRDQVDVYTSTPLNTTARNTVETLCHDDTFCCHFNITTTYDDSALTTANHYHYRLVAFSGVRSFSGMYNGGVELCAVIFCQNATHLESCATRFANYSTISWPTTFERVEIRANFSDVHTRQQFPNSLLGSIRPVLPNATQWSAVEYDGVVERRFELVEAQKRLLTFAIYGRDFARDSDPFASGGDAKMLPLCFSLLVVVAVMLVL